MPTVQIVINPEIKAALERLAKADGRSVSNLARKAVVEWIAAQPKTERKKP